MRSDEALELLERENPVREDDLPGPNSVDALAVKSHVCLGAATRDRARRRRPIGPAFRAVAVAAAAAAIVLGVLGALPGNGPSAVERAEAALNPSDGTILRTVVLTTRSDSDRSETSESWQLNAPPYDRREVTSRGHELATANSRPQVYDARINTIYTVPPETELPPSTRPPGEDRLLQYMRSLLASGQAREDGPVTVDGRSAIRIVSSVANATLLVDADTYEPIEWRLVSDEGIGVTSRFRTYELLLATEANLALVSLTAQHPDAIVEPSLVIKGVGPDPDK